MTFRAQLAADLSGVFLDEEAFGEAVVIDDVAVVAVRGDDLADERTRGAWPAEPGYARQLTLHLQDDLLPARPVEDQVLRVALDGGDAQRWTVASASAEEGLLSLRLERAES